MTPDDQYKMKDAVKIAQSKKKITNLELAKGLLIKLFSKAVAYLYVAMILVPRLKFLSFENLVSYQETGLRDYVDSSYWSKFEETDVCGRMGNSTYINHSIFDTVRELPSDQSCKLDMTMLPSMTEYYVKYLTMPGETPVNTNLTIPTIADKLKPTRLKNLFRITQLRFKHFSNAHQLDKMQAKLKRKQSADLGAVSRDDYLREELNEIMKIEANRSDRFTSPTTVRSYHLHYGIVRRPYFYKGEKRYAAKIYFDIFVFDASENKAKIYVVKTFEFQTNKFKGMEENLVQMEYSEELQKWQIRAITTYEIVKDETKSSNFQAFINLLKTFSDILILIKLFRETKSVYITSPIDKAEEAADEQEIEISSLYAQQFDSLAYLWIKLTGLQYGNFVNMIKVRKLFSIDDITVQNNWVLSLITVLHYSVALDRSLFLGMDDIHRVFFQEKIPLDLGIVASMLSMTQFILAVHILLGMAFNGVFIWFKSNFSYQSIPGLQKIFAHPLTLIIEEFKLISIAYATISTIKEVTGTIVCGLADTTETSSFNPTSLISLDMVIPYQIARIVVVNTAIGMLISWVCTYVLLLLTFQSRSNHKFLKSCELMGYPFVPIGYVLRPDCYTSFLEIATVLTSNYSLRLTGQTVCPEAVRWTLRYHKSEDRLRFQYAQYGNEHEIPQVQLAARKATSLREDLTDDTQYTIEFHQTNTGQILPFLTIPNSKLVLLNAVRIIRWIKGKTRIRMA